MRDDLQAPARPAATGYAPPGAAASPAVSPETTPPGAASPDPGSADPGSPEAAPAVGPPPDDPLGLPRDTTPTWEIELLVSGAVLFGLLQLPSLFHEVTDRWLAHVAVPGLFAVTIVNILLVGAVYALAACFVAHLVLRGYWVALVGVHSVFPHGPRWDRAKQYGPIQAEIMRERVRPLPEFVARVDNTASLVFAAGFVLAASTITSSVFLAAIVIPAWAVERAFGMSAVLWLLGAVLTPMLVVTLAVAVAEYRKRGATVDPSSTYARVVRAVLRPSAALLPAGVRSLSTVLMTNVAPRVVGSAMAVGLSVALGGAMLRASGGDMPGAANYRFFDDDSPSAVMAVRYESLRGDEPASTRAPSLDADVVNGPYLRLFIPYRLALHNRALAATCPGLRPLTDEDDETPAGRAAAEATLRCAERLHAVTLDGRPVDGLRFRFFADPRANRRGFLAYVPTESLARGEHRLTVRPVPSARRRATAPYELPFWK